MARSGLALTLVLFCVAGCDAFLALGPNGCDAEHPCQDPARPRCDLEAGLCLPPSAEEGRVCVDHFECPSLICDEHGVVTGAGRCLPESAVVTVHSAVELWTALTRYRGIRLSGGTYQGAWRVDGAAAILVGPRAGSFGRVAPPPPAVLSPIGAGDPVLRVAGRARLVLDGLSVQGGQGPGGHGIYGEDPESRLFVRRSEVAGNGGRGVWSRGPLLVTQSSVGSGDDARRNRGGGVLAESDLTLTNSFVSHNGTEFSSVGGVALSAAPASAPRYLLAHLTFVGNMVGTQGSAVHCGAGAPVRVWHSMFVSNEHPTGQVVTERCEVVSVAVDDQRIMVVGSAHMLDKDHPPAFRGSSDFHIGADSWARDKVASGVGPALALDVDGDPRPTGAGSDLGADEYVP